MLIEVGKSMSWFLTVRWINRGGRCGCLPVQRVARGLDTAMLGQSIRRVIRELDAALLEHVVVEAGVGSLVV